MVSIDYEGMKVLEDNRTKKIKELNDITKETFDLTKKEHIQTLQKYMNNFEYTLNQMYLFNSMEKGLLPGGVSWAISYFLPIPNFIAYFSSVLIWFGAVGSILKNFSMTDYYEQLNEMKTLYNWCLKNNEEQYNSKSDNTEKLANEDIQRLIRLIAPLCSVDFMLAWSKETVKPSENSSGLGKLLSSISVTALSTFSLFSSGKDGVDLTQVRNLKIAVELGDFKVGAVKGFEQALVYFATNTNFRTLCTEKIVHYAYEAKSSIPFMPNP